MEQGLFSDWLLAGCQTGSPLDFVGPATKENIDNLSPKEKRDLVFLFSLMADQRDWLLDNLKWIVKNSKGDVITSWLCQYVSDPFGYVEALPDSVWDGCLADYCGERDEITEKWWLTSRGCK